MKIGEIELTTPGDIIVGGAGYVCGFAVDAFFFIDGAASAEVAGATAMGALSVKYAVQTGWGKLRARRRPRIPTRPPSSDL